MHGFREERRDDGSLEPRYIKATDPELETILNELLGPGMDVRKITVSTARSQRISDEMVRRISQAQQHGNRDNVQSLVSQAALELMDAWGIPHSFSRSLGLSFDRIVKLIRATRATLMCVLLHSEHPLVLITRASKGDRQAVLDLVRADNLFMHDRCCVGVIKKAELQDDHVFVKQLKTAVSYQATPHRRNVMHILFYILLLLELRGVSLPTLQELWFTFDPHGREYESLSAFEKDFQRRRNDFGRMLAAAEVEVPVQWVKTSKDAPSENKS
jgi:hypothetical protein